MEIIVFNFGENKERYHEKLKFLGPVLGLVILLSGCAKWIDQGIDHRCRLIRITAVSRDCGRRIPK